MSDKIETIDLMDCKVMLVVVPIATEEANLTVCITGDKTNDAGEKIYTRSMVKYIDERSGDKGPVVGRVVSVTLLAPYVNPHLEFEDSPYMTEFEIDGGISFDPESDEISYFTPADMEALEEVSGV